MAENLLWIMLVLVAVRIIQVYAILGQANQVDNPPPPVQESEPNAQPITVQREHYF